MLRPLLAALLLAPLAALADPVTIQVTFDDATSQALEKAGELVTVSGYFYGEPAPKATLTPDEMDQIYLGGEEFTIRPVNQTLTLGQTLTAAPVDQVVEPFLNVNVFSARISSEDNLLDCVFLDDSVKTLQAAPQVLACKLLK